MVEAESVPEILENWGFPFLVEVFEENEINMEAFKNLSDDIIKEIIPKAGPRILFKKKYLNFKNSFELDQSDSSITNTASTSTSHSFDSCLPSPSPSDKMEDYSHSSNFFPDADLGLTKEEAEKTPGARYRKQVQDDCEKETNLGTILKKSNKGKIILGFYDQNKRLTDVQRDKLVEIIIENEISNNIDTRISTERFEKLSNAIVSIFPTEIKEIYFSISLKKKKNNSWHKIGCGKLFRKFYNYRRHLRGSGLLTKYVNPDEKSSYVGNADDDDELTWLKNSLEPWTDVIQHWENTYDKRAPYRNVSIMEYMNIFPALKLKMGYTLLQKDFNRMFPDLEMKLFSNFQSFSRAILNYAKTLKTKDVVEYIQKFETELSQDAHSCYIFYLLPLLMKPVVVKKTKGSGLWKPSKIETSEGFILHVKIPGEIKPTLERRQAKLASFGLTRQPTPIIVGPDFSSIQSWHVSIDDILYEVPTPLKAVDVTFKLIHALNACYPKESEQVWLLIQKALYEVDTPFDQKFVAVAALLNELKQEKES